jgi:outer membrane lipoprotein-sorting protein
VTGEEEVAGRACWVVHQTAGTQDVTYQTRKMWVDKERWLPFKEERYAKSGRLLKTKTIEEVFKISGRWYPR